MRIFWSQIEKHSRNTFVANIIRNLFIQKHLFIENPNIEICTETESVTTAIETKTNHGYQKDEPYLDIIFHYISNLGKALIR